MKRSPDQSPPRRTLAEFAREVGANRRRLVRQFALDPGRPQPLPAQPITQVLLYCQAELRRWWAASHNTGQLAGREV